MQIRVALVGDYPLDPNRVWGGEQAAFRYLVDGLSQLAPVDVHVLTPARSAQSEPLESIQSNGCTVHRLPPLQRLEMYRRYAPFVRNVGAALKRIQPNVVHAQGILHPAWAALASGYPSVVTLHGVQAEEIRHQSASRLRFRKWLSAHLVERRNLRRVRHLIALGRFVTDYFSSILSPATRCHYVPNAIRDEYFSEGGTGSAYSVLFAGRVIQRKRVLDLVRAFEVVVRRRPAARLRIAGEYTSEPDYAHRVRQLIYSSGLDESVRMLGPLSEQEILREFSDCSVLALPSGQETTPMVIAQAMAAGRAVVATPVGGVSEMVQEGVTGHLVPVGDAQGLARALVHLLGDPGLRKKMGRAGRRKAEREYRANTVAQRTVRVYREMIEGA